MGKQYTHVTNDQRKELIRLIHEEQMSISQAAAKANIFYPTAKAINKVYKKENRVQKRYHRYRQKKGDELMGVKRNKIALEKPLENKMDYNDVGRITCGIKSIVKKDAKVLIKKEVDLNSQVLYENFPQIHE